MEPTGAYHPPPARRLWIARSGLSNKGSPPSSSPPFSRLLVLHPIFSENGGQGGYQRNRKAVVTFAADRLRDDGLHALFLCQRLRKAPHALHILILAIRLDQAAPAHHVIRDDQAARVHQIEHPGQVSRRVGLIGVDKDQVEGAAPFGY